MHSLPIALAIALATAAVAHNISYIHSHEMGAAAMFAHIAGTWLPIGIMVVMGIILLLLKAPSAQSGTGGINRAMWVFAIAFATLVLTGFIDSFKAKPATGKVLLQVTNGAGSDFAGGTCIQLQEQNVYTIADGNGLGYTWYDGTYAIRGDSVFLTNTERKPHAYLTLKRDSTGSVTSAEYISYEMGSELIVDSNFKVVFDSLALPPIK